MSGNNQHFDLHTTGFGFLNRARLVTPKKGQPFYAVTIAALRGNDGEKTYIDCNVVGKEAIELFKTHNIDQLKLGKDGQDKATMSFVVGDLYLDEFTYPANHATRAGQVGFSLKGRLLRIKHLKINDVVVHETSKDKPAANQQAA